MLQMLKTKIDGDLVTALEAASKNIVTKNLLMPCSISDGYLVFPKSRIKSKKVLKHLIKTGRIEPV